MHSNDIFNIQVQHEVIQVALKGLDTEHALVEKELKQEMSSVVHALQKKKLLENYKKVCVELADATEKNKSLEEHIGVLQTQVLHVFRTSPKRVPDGPFLPEFKCGSVLVGHVLTLAWRVPR